MPLKIAFREYGSGSTVVLLHGYAGSPLHWDYVVQQLSPTYKVIVPNLSHLSMGGDKITFSGQIDLLAAFLRHHCPLEAVKLVGISFGGALAWGLAIRYPELVDRVVFINPMAPFPVQSFRQFGLRMFYTLPLGFREIWYFLRTPMGHKFLKNIGAVFRNLTGEGDEERLLHLQGRKLNFVCHLFQKFGWIVRNERWDIWEKKLDFWTHDCLLIYEKQDPLFSVDFYESFGRILSCDKVVETNEAGHISILNQPELISQAIVDFLVGTTDLKASSF